MISLSYAIFASGTGSNAMSLINMGKELECLPQFILSNRKDCLLIDKVKSIHSTIPTYVVESNGPKADVHYDRQVLEICQKHNVDWVLLAGFMKILSTDFLDYFKSESFSKVINIHPSLLPKYKGLHAYERSFESQDNEYGHTLHLVDEKIDHGAVLSQRVLNKRGSDTLDSFKERGLKYENHDYAQLLKGMITKGESYILSCQKNPIIKKEDEL